MILKVIEPIYKKKQISEDEIEEVYVKSVIKKMEISEITEFCQMINDKSKKPYKDRCMLRTMDGWIIVKHSFDELSKLKDKPNRIEIKGFYGKIPARSNKNTRRSK